MKNDFDFELLRDPTELARRLAESRTQSVELIAGLSDADLTVQSMEDASPAKWHLAHTTWFFEEFVLGTYGRAYRPFDARYRFLFNSYYETVGARHPRPQRGLLTRPAIGEILAYRAHVDAAMEALLASPLPAPALHLIELGIQHEQQHQELLLTDLLHLFAQNPLRPAWRSSGRSTAADEAAAAAPHAGSPIFGESVPHTGSPTSVDSAPGLESPAWVEFDGGCFEVGHDGGGFAFDCETPRHRVLLEPYALADRLVTNREWLSFIEDGGYQTPQLWLADGWKQVQEAGWQAPFYWRDHASGEGPQGRAAQGGSPPAFPAAGRWRAMSLFGETDIDLDAPVTHVSYFEADAFARWAGARLPTEFEWEVAARRQPVSGNLASAGLYRPRAATLDRQAPLRQIYGDVWEWTASAYSAYPRFRTAAGAVGEYNGKFMSGQFVLRGGSCVTPAGHVRASYRNFFYPHQRWQFTGLRLARL
jgi:ergothioneine biosynthesis protein EgtB